MADKATWIAAGARIGAVEAFVLDCIVPEPRRLVTCSDVFRAYRAWCVARDLVPLREAIFTDQICTLVTEAGLATEMIRQQGSNLTFVDVKLVDAPA